MKINMKTNVDRTIKDWTLYMITSACIPYWKVALRYIFGERMNGYKVLIMVPPLGRLIAVGENFNRKT